MLRKDSGTGGGSKKKRTKVRKKPYGSAPKTVQGGTARAFERSRSHSPSGEASDKLIRAMGWKTPWAKKRKSAKKNTVTLTSITKTYRKSK